MRRVGLGVLLAALWLGLAAPALAKGVERMEPASWWIGFRDPGLELMVYGQGAGRWTPRIERAGVRITGFEAAPNPNYLFVRLEISPDAAPGPVAIRFMDGARVVDRRVLDLQARAPGSARRAGFGPQDAIYLVTPDRFVNGDSANDRVKGLKEGPDRSFHGGRHGGDLAGLAGHLDYIADMGFTQVWLNPVLENDMPAYSYHGYATTDFYKVDPRYGYNSELKDLARKARAQGVGLIMDMIVNHIGSEHWWMRDLPSPDWIHNNGKFAPTNHVHTAQMDAHVAPSEAKIFEEGWFAETMPDLNQDNPHLARYLIQNTLWWIEYAGLSGIRMDTYPYPDKAFMAGWSRRVLEEYPDFTVVGEEWSRHPNVVAYWQKGARNLDGYVSHLPSLMDFPLQYSLVQALIEPESVFPVTGFLRLYETVANDFVYPDPDGLVVFADNHDMDRIHTQLGGDLALNRMALGYIATMRGVPQVYYGTEILAQNPGTHEHGVLRADFPGGWRGDAVNAFTGEGLREEQRAFQAYVRRLFTWRKTQPVLQEGKLIHYYPLPADPFWSGVYVYGRMIPDDAVLVAMNKTNEIKDLPAGRFQDVLQGRTKGLDIVSGERVDLRAVVRVPPRSLVIIDLD